MMKGYSFALAAPRGKGTFDRMKEALKNHARLVVGSMFDEAANELLKSIRDLIQELASMIVGTSASIHDSLFRVYSVCWGDFQEAFEMLYPAKQEMIRACRNRLVPDIIQWRHAHNQILTILGIEGKDEVDLDVVGVVSLSERRAQEMTQARLGANYFEILDDSGCEKTIVRQMLPPLGRQLAKSM